MSLRASLRPLGLRRAGRLLPSQLFLAALSLTSAKMHAPPVGRSSAIDKQADRNDLRMLRVAVLQPLFLQDTARETAVTALEEMEHRLTSEKVRGTVVRNFDLERYQALETSCELIRMHLIPQILGTGFFSGFGSAHVPWFIPKNLTIAQCRVNAILPRSRSNRDLALALLGIVMAVFWSLVGAGVCAGVSPVVAAGCAALLSYGILCADAILCNTTGHSIVVEPLYRIGVALHWKLTRREKTSMHEAGHFLLAYTHGLPLFGYRISSIIDIFLLGQAGQVVVGQDTVLSDTLLFKWTSMGMAGVAAECVYQGFSECGCADDVRQADELLRKHKPKWSAERRAAYQNVALYYAHHLLRQHEPILRELAAAMKRGKSFARCCAVVADAFDAVAAKRP
ncbi:hypothetical protein T492DRAFT_844056 [Pavlovales sp. CCMP2436]|nr:hypothetical protein T492DRAFT_844056 [Pavlovales sp. CCMP2436]